MTSVPSLVTTHNSGTRHTPNTNDETHITFEEIHAILVRCQQLASRTTELCSALKPAHAKRNRDKQKEQTRKICTKAKSTKRKSKAAQQQPPWSYLMPSDAITVCGMTSPRRANNAMHSCAISEMAAGSPVRCTIASSAPSTLSQSSSSLLTSCPHSRHDDVIKEEEEEESGTPCGSGWPARHVPQSSACDGVTAARPPARAALGA